MDQDHISFSLPPAELFHHVMPPLLLFAVEKYELSNTICFL